MSTETTFEEILEHHGKLVYKTKGISMLPMLRQNRDLVIIEKPQGRLKKYDVALYKRGSKYVLHRVISVREKDYVIRGDNTYKPEYGISDKNIIGVLKMFVRDGKEINIENKKYCAYVYFWCAIYPIRLFYKKVRSFLGKIKRKFSKTI